MKKTLSAILVMILSAFGANAFADKLDLAVKKVVIESSDQTGSDNHGVKSCGSKIGK